MLLQVAVQVEGSDLCRISPRPTEKFAAVEPFGFPPCDGSVTTDSDQNHGGGPSAPDVLAPLLWGNRDRRRYAGAILRECGAQGP